MSHIQRILACAIAATALGIATPASAQSAEPGAVATLSTSGPTTAPIERNADHAADAARYTQRESRDAAVRAFKGGDHIVVFVSSGAVVLVALILVLLLV